MMPDSGRAHHPEALAFRYCPLDDWQRLPAPQPHRSGEFSHGTPGLTGVLFLLLLLPAIASWSSCRAARRRVYPSFRRVSLRKKPRRSGAEQKGQNRGDRRDTHSVLIASKGVLIGTVSWSEAVQLEPFALRHPAPLSTARVGQQPANFVSAGDKHKLCEPVHIQRAGLSVTSLAASLISIRHRGIDSL